MKHQKIGAGMSVINQALSALIRDKIEGLKFFAKGVPKCLLIRYNLSNIFINICTVPRAELFLMGNAPDLACRDVVEILKEDPDNFVATCIKARCMFLMGDFVMSLMVWHQARKMRGKGNVKEVMWVNVLVQL